MAKSIQLSQISLAKNLEELKSKLPSGYKVEEAKNGIVVKKASKKLGVKDLNKVLAEEVKKEKASADQKQKAEKQEVNRQKQAELLKQRTQEKQKLAQQELEQLLPKITNIYREITKLSAQQDSTSRELENLEKITDVEDLDSLMKYQSMLTSTFIMKSEFFAKHKILTDIDQTNLESVKLGLQKIQKLDDQISLMSIVSIPPNLKQLFHACFNSPILA